MHWFAKRLHLHDHLGIGFEFAWQRAESRSLQDEAALVIMLIEAAAATSGIGIDGGQQRCCQRFWSCEMWSRFQKAVQGRFLQSRTRWNARKSASAMIPSSSALLSRFSNRTK
jgi:uncharacterized protein YggL (DUF469 family)